MARKKKKKGKTPVDDSNNESSTAEVTEDDWTDEPAEGLETEADESPVESPAPKPEPVQPKKEPTKIGATKANRVPGKMRKFL